MNAELLAALPPGPWAYMPGEYDIWGNVRCADGPVVAVTCSPLEAQIFSAAVKFGSDEWKAGPPKARAVAQLLIEAQAEADPTPVDVDWMRSLGFTEYGTFIDGWGGHEGGLSLGSLEWHCMRAFRFDGREFMEANNPTRGQVRKLASALQITLKEVAAGAVAG